MSTISDYFPYTEYRKGQEEMLETAADSIRNRDILMIDAPTGSGKSSLIVPLLAEANGHKILVAVRTNSQLEIFLNELQRIRDTKKPDLKFVYLIGKSKICPYGKMNNIYKVCEKLRNRTFNLLQSIENNNPGVNPLKSSELQEILKNEDPDSPTICQYYLNSYQYSHNTEEWDNEYNQHEPVDTMFDKIEHVLSNVVYPNDIQTFAGIFCPHAILWQAVSKANVIILNYHYLLRDEIRTPLFKAINSKPENTLLLLDEGHNLGETLQGINTRSFSSDALEKADDELKKYKKDEKMNVNFDAVSLMIRRMHLLMNGCSQTGDKEGLLSLDEIKKFMFSNSNWDNLEDLLRATSILIIAIQNKGTTDSNIEKLFYFIVRLSQIDPESDAYITVFRKKEEKIMIEIRYINPGEFIQQFTASFQSVILASGTFSPLNSYEKYYFGDKKVRLLAVPNAFPKENRLILCARDITSAYRSRNDKDMQNSIVAYIIELCKIPGNVAVFFTSYNEMERIVSKCKKRIKTKIIFEEDHDPEKATQMVQKFMKLPELGGQGILFGVCGGKWSEGLDYKGDMLHAVLVLGLPLTEFSSIQKEINRRFCQKYGENEGDFIAYNLPAMNKALQALGRVLRTEKDCGILILGDNRYQGLVKSKLPEWIKNEMVPCNKDTLPNQITSWCKEKYRT